VLFVFALWSATACGRRPDQRALPGWHEGFAQLVERLSEPGGYFDTDNLISNERSYLHVIGQLDQRNVQGGAYIGVGPDQNFSYIAAIRPQVAFIVDIRRDNLLQHLMFKALFELSRNRLEYLSLLHARPLPGPLENWDGRAIEDLVAYIDTVTVVSADANDTFRRIDSTVVTFGVPLSDADHETISRFHGAFVREGLGLRFRSYGRRPLPHYPTFRDLLLETDLAGRQASYLADESAFRFVKSLQERDRVIPVVGDLAGVHALPAIAAFLDERNVTVSAFYTSNVEFYLMRSGGFTQFADNVAGLPIGKKSVLIRSVFNRTFWYTHPRSVPGYASVQLVQSLQEFTNTMSGAGYSSYQELVIDDAATVQR
jgi:hypothetical protein